MKRIFIGTGLLSLAAALFFVCAAASGSSAQEPDEKSVSAAFSGMIFIKAIDMLAGSASGVVINYDASLCVPGSHILDLKRIDVPAAITLSFQELPLGKALQTVLNKAYSPLTYRRIGDVYTIIPDPSRKPTPHPAAMDVPLRTSRSFTFTDTPFDEAIDMLFRTYGLPYAIQPDVSVIRDPVTCVIANAGVDEAANTVLEALKTRLAVRYQGGMFEIVNKDSAATNTESHAPNNPTGGVDLALTGSPLEEAVVDVLRGKNANYIYMGSLLGRQRVALHRHFDSQEAAVVALLRCAQANPMRIYRNEGNVVTLLTTEQGPRAAAPSPATITCHCTDVNFGDVAKVVFRTFRKNYLISGPLLSATVTLTLDHATFDEAYKAICKALPANSAHINGDRYDFGN